jgi:hypothetical protein
MGRPSTYSDAIADAIVDAIAEGGLITRICQKDGFPDYKTFRRWRDERDDFAKRIAHARKDQSEVYRDEITELNASMDAANWQYVNARIRNTQWLLGKLNSAQYGDKLQHTDPDGNGPVQIVVKHIGSDGE